ncbi:hypothetical protein [Catellatospora vulcania]|uniref:hypothetical protein n=1 Tax=Catellatospora vulcania TaxID=1460450 RepID=UPI0012D3A322|nr:hypothetical protein [Catellatospora vulcania]
MNDDLFQPTIGARPVVTERPWRPSSLVYPAFFGGPLAVTMLGVLNARRLSLGRNQQLILAGAGLAAILARLAVTGLLGGQVGARTLGTLFGLAVWGLIAATQKKAFRAYQYGDGEPASLFGPGLAAVIGCGLLENLLIAVVVD